MFCYLFLLVFDFQLDWVTWAELAVSYPGGGGAATPLHSPGYDTAQRFCSGIRNVGSSDCMSFDVSFSEVLIHNL